MRFESGPGEFYRSAEAGPCQVRVASRTILAHSCSDEAAAGQEIVFQVWVSRVIHDEKVT